MTKLDELTAVTFSEIYGKSITTLEELHTIQFEVAMAELDRRTEFLRALNDPTCRLDGGTYIQEAILY